MNFNLSYPNLYFSHKMDVGPNFSETFEDHYHLIYEIIYLVSGNIDLILENRKFHVSIGDMLFIQPGQHHFIEPNLTTKYERYVLKFPEYEIPKDLLPQIKRLPTCISTKKTVLPKLFERLDWHYETYNGNGLKYLMENALKDILVYASSVKQPKEEEIIFYNPKMIKVIDYINENISQPLKINDICEHFHYSKSYICKEFAKCMNVPIKQYVRAKKVLLADSLIKMGIRPSDVYKQCGFIDYSTFFRDYCKIIGKPPSAD